MRICHITTVHSPFDVRIFYKECVSLAEAGYETFLIAPHTKSESKSGVTIIPFWKIKNRFFRILLLPYIAFFKALKCRASVYHFHDPELLPVGVLLKIFTRKKIIYDVHEDYFAQTLSKDYIPGPFRLVIAYSIAFVEKFCILFFDGIVSATDSINQKFKGHKNAICVHNYPIFKDEKGRGQKAGQKPFTLIYTGSICRIRGITQVLKSLEKIPADKNIRLILCGEFESDQYKNELFRMKGFERTEYCGWIPPEKLREMVNNSDAGLVCFMPEPNHVEAMPNKIFEYMASAIPVIASDFPLWKKIVEDNHSGVCANPLDPDAIASAILFLYENRDSATQMGANGQKAVSNLFNWNIEKKCLLEFYNKLLN